MARYHRRHRGPHWRRHVAISLTGAMYTGLVVLIFAVVKFTEGAWLVVVVFPILVFALDPAEPAVPDGSDGAGGHRQPRAGRRSRRRTRAAASTSSSMTSTSPPSPPSGTPAACGRRRCARCTSSSTTSRPTSCAQDWLRANPGIPLDFVDCPDRRLANAAANLVSAEAALPGVGVTAVLPRRSYAPIVGRLLHDRTADKMASLISRIPHAAATIVPFDVRSRVESLARRRANGAGRRRGARCHSPPRRRPSRRAAAAAPTAADPASEPISRGRTPPRPPPIADRTSGRRRGGGSRPSAR